MWTSEKGITTECEKCNQIYFKVGISLKNICTDCQLEQLNNL